MREAPRCPLAQSGEARALPARPAVRATPEMSSPSDSEHLRLSAADFDAYLPERAPSNAFNAQRAELKSRLRAWAHSVEARLAELGIAVDVAESDEQPTLRNGRRVDWQRVVFWRDAAARSSARIRCARRRPHCWDTYRNNCGLRGR